MTNTERVQRYRKRQSALGREKRELYLTAKEFADVKDIVKEMRNNKEYLTKLLALHETIN